MTTKEFLLDQFTYNYDANGWFVAVKNALQNLTAEQAAWKPEGADNSIWEILSHLNYYNNAYLQRFKGVDYVYGVSSNDETFSSAGEATEDAWAAEVEKFVALMEEWKKLLETADEKKFSEPVSEKNQARWAEIVGLINAHSAHRGGQIVLLRKLQGSWDASKGVS